LRLRYRVVRVDSPRSLRTRKEAQMWLDGMFLTAFLVLAGIFVVLLPEG
jgi:hypothetical protein